jgi:hypothetical protein
LRLRWPLALNFAEFGMKIFVNLEVALSQNLPSFKLMLIDSI